MSFKSLVRAAIPPAAHAQKFALPAAVVTVLPSLLYTSIGVLGPLSTAVAVIWGVTLLAALVHDQSAALCIRCIKEVPADAPVRAQRRMLVLWFHHFTARPVVAVLALSLLFFGPNLLMLALHLHVSALTAVPGILWGFFCASAAWQHRQLRPWCSYCRGWDDGGDHEPSPDPVTSGTKTVH